MGLTVYANNMGWFHKGSGGKGIGPLDVCLSPPPPPTGPVPIPYVNIAQADDLSKGSKTVLADGETTALEDQSYTSTSTGDEGGTQGGSVITHKTKGKGYFLVWSRTVLVEGKGVCRHGDMMGHNCASKPSSCVNAGALAKFDASLGDGQSMKPCKRKYKRPKNNPTTDQKDKANQRGKYKNRKKLVCWQCRKPQEDGKSYVADHQPPLKMAWMMGGCHMGKEKFEKWAETLDIIFPHCRRCSSSQGGQMRDLTRDKIRTFMKGI